MEAQLIAAGLLAVLGAAFHAVGGEVQVVRRLSPEMLPPSPYGGSRMTKALIHATWHMTTVTFLFVGISLLLAGSVLAADAAETVAVIAAGALTAFAVIALGMASAYIRSPGFVIREPGPAMLAVIAMLAWWGAVGG